MVREIQNGRWESSFTAIAEARKKVFEQHNIMIVLGELANKAVETPRAEQARKHRYIWSERSLLPEQGARGSLPEWAFRNAILLFDPLAELKTVNLRRKADEWRSKRRAQKLALQENAKD